MSARHPVREAGGSPSCEAAFNEVAAGQTPRCRARTLHWLEEHGLIERHSTVVGRDRFGDIVRPTFSVPTWVHIRWCEWGSRAEERRASMRRRLGK